MTKLVAGKTGPLKAASTEAVRALMRKRVGEGTIERPDVTTEVSDIVDVKVKVVAPKAAALLQQHEK